MSRRLVTIHQFAKHMQVAERTARNWASEGHFNLYRVPGIRGALVDLDEAEAAIRALPSTVVRPGFGSYGPKARVVDLPAQAVVVQDAS